MALGCRSAENGKSSERSQSAEIAEASPSPTLDTEKAVLRTHAQAIKAGNIDAKELETIAAAEAAIYDQSTPAQREELRRFSLALFSAGTETKGLPGAPQETASSAEGSYRQAVQRIGLVVGPQPSLAERKEAAANRIALAKPAVANNGATPMTSCTEDCDGEYRCIAGSCYRYTCNHSSGRCDFQPAVGCPGNCD